MTVSMTHPSDCVEIITSVQRRRRWTAAQKMRIVEETLEPGATVSEVARRHEVAPNQLFTWRRLAAQGALTAADAGEEVVPASHYRALQNQVRELQRLLGKKTLEAEILKEALERTGSKNSCCAPAGPRRLPDESCRPDARAGPLQSCRPDEAAPAQARRPTASAGGGPRGRDQGHHRRSADLRCRPTAIAACTRSCAAGHGQRGDRPPITSGSIV
jgi:transposase